MVGINYFSKQNLLYSQAKAVAIEKIKIPKYYQCQ